MFATSPPCANNLPLPPLKRKRSDSTHDATGRDAPVASKLRVDNSPPDPALVTHCAPSPSPSPTSDPTAPVQTPPSPTHRPSQSLATEQAPRSGQVDVDRLRDTLGAQLSLEVLLKHNELRLIDQEIAKCQVALEQLRRCAEIPYPSAQLGGLSQSVSSGTGMAVYAPGNGPAPLSPAPWGVTDGPYTRHYARWLLPDARFDGGEPDPATPLLSASAAGATPVEGRSTRGNPGDLGALAGKSRPQRGSSISKLQSLPNGYPAPKEKAGPMIIRRKSDGIMVKLVCLDCRRDNFSSTQGFINHCRIAHGRNFASHDAAAMASGETVEVDEAGAAVGVKSETPTTTAPTTTPGYVHPLIRSAHGIEPLTPGRSMSSAVETPRPTGPSVPAKSTTPATTEGLSPHTFLGSPDTPHLSSLMRHRGVGLDLDRLVGEAKTTVDLSVYPSDEGESDSEPEQSTPHTVGNSGPPPPGAGVGRQPMRTTVSQTMSRRPGSRKGVDPPSHPTPLETLTPTRPGPSYPSYGPPPLANPGPGDALRDADSMDRTANLSPNTMESTQAPSLVSDDDDYGVASDSESPGPSSSEAGDHDDEFSHVDVEDEEAATSTATTDPPKTDPMASAAAHPPASLSRSLARGGSRGKGRLVPSSLVPMQRNKDEKRVSFVKSPYTPQSITLETFTRLLSLYPMTWEAATRQKLAEGGRRGGKKTKSISMEEEQESKCKGKDQGKGKEEQNHLIEGIMEGLGELDRWRYELVGVDVSGSGWMDDVGDGDGRCLTKDDLVRLMEWKLQRGVHRPALLGMIKSNPDKTVEQATRAALAALPGKNLSQQNKPAHGSKNPNPEGQFPQTSLTELINPLRGVGIATASLILSAVTAHNKGGGIPFFSDDVYLWLCMGEVPRLRSELARESKERVQRRKSCYKRLGGELALKYNVKEYEGLWEAVQFLRGRLLWGVEDGKEEVVLCTNIEKVAFVLRHIELSGFVSEGGEGLVSVDRGCLGEEKKGDMKEEKQKRGRVEESVKEEVGGRKKRSRKG
ncbi:hypothetical protein P168DRAFT_243418 [Aspergillus campestris IBT 28561]|uniref:AHC1-like C2H2 zinc-finger domain-containing protein n=1 Tax=Aspergillus campestris (strain IBT 28561) TaxID=1392248 RepID=A0A2I1CTD4_ASPC2|nr:uncharacterized protein P168DRAFT_243418 [Aspergillus campestris IBT 28561]PKY00871.1 hypothetical protein P168DRAFT_243418 [Aspergillus campestris IBT 28561]